MALARASPRRPPLPQSFLLRSCATPWPHPDHYAFLSPVVPPGALQASLRVRHGLASSLSSPFMASHPSLRLHLFRASLSRSSFVSALSGCVLRCLVGGYPRSVPQHLLRLISSVLAFVPSCLLRPSVALQFPTAIPPQSPCICLDTPL